MNIIWKGSPNKDGKELRKPIDRVVMHWFGTGTLESANNRFTSTTGGASAHYGISGKTVYQWVKEDEVAWHAGVYPMNQRSIGIEHDATTDHDASNDTIKTSAELLADICKRNKIPLDRTHIIGHKESGYATQCPGTLPIDKIIDLAKKILGGVTETPSTLGPKEIHVMDVGKKLDDESFKKIGWEGKFPRDTALDTAGDLYKKILVDLDKINKKCDLMKEDLNVANKKIAAFAEETFLQEKKCKEVSESLEKEIALLKENKDDKEEIYLKQLEEKETIITAQIAEIALLKKQLEKVAWFFSTIEALKKYLTKLKDKKN